MLDVVADVFGVKTFPGGARVLAEGVKSAEPVSAFDPADEEPDAANEDAAAAPDWPEEALD